MATRAKDAGKKAGKRKTGSKATTTVNWYVDLMGIDDHELSPNLYIGPFAEASARAQRIAAGITALVECGLPGNELSVRMGIYEVVKGGAA